MKGRYEIELNCGRNIHLEVLFQYRTYRGLLEGLPTKRLNRELVNHAQECAKDKLWLSGTPFLIDPLENLLPLPKGYRLIANEENCPNPMTLTTDAQRMLLAYDWPGNVRELRNAIERAVILTRPANQVRAQNLSFLPSTQLGETQLRFNEEPTLEQIERDYLQMILAKYGGNRLKTAEVLGGSERQVYRLIEKYR